MSTSRRKRERRTRRRGATGARRRPPFDWARRGRTSTAPAVDSFTEHREAVLEPVSGRERGRLARCGLVDGSCSETRIVRVDHRRRRCSVRSIDLRCANVTLDRCANRTLTSVRLARGRRRMRGSGPRKATGTALPRGLWRSADRGLPPIARERYRSPVNASSWTAVHLRFWRNSAPYLWL